jgi:hypothetical protein
MTGGMYAHSRFIRHSDQAGEVTRRKGHRKGCRAVFRDGAFQGEILGGGFRSVHHQCSSQVFRHEIDMKMPSVLSAYGLLIFAALFLLFLYFTREMFQEG